MTNSGFIPSLEGIRSLLLDFLKGKAGIWLYIATVGVLLGVYAVVFTLVKGHGAAVNTTSLAPWGVQITTYVYLVLIATGLAFMHFFGEAFLGDDYRPFSVRILFLAFFSALCGMGSLATELGHVERMFYFLLSPNPRSPMWWMAVWYTLELLVLALEYVFAKFQRHSKILSFSALIIGAFTVGTLGTLFGSIEARHYFYSALMPVYFLVFAFVTGASVALIVTVSRIQRAGGPQLAENFRKILAVGLGMASFLAVWRLVIGLYGISDGSEAFELTLKTQLLWDIFLGGLVPLFMALVSKKPSSMLLTGLWVLIAQFIVRFNLVSGGFTVPIFRAYDIPQTIHYTPSYVEWFVVVASISLVVFLYATAERTGILESRASERGLH